ncbi:MAG: UDP-N-acetylmuramate dehydrogenase, partial [Clostridia bacterium]|nr:UDP-N-acetylmuramate dehydrogenase [Clostridia bacterium]
FSGMRALACEGNTVFAEAGVTGGGLLRFAAGQHLGGFEHFTGIPMSIGGGVTMNAGVSAGHFSDIVEKVVAFDGRAVREFSAEECEFREKQSVFMEGIAVLGVYLRAKQSFPEQIAQNLCYYRNRRAHLPKGRSMGCTFVNPTGISAGELIDSCGLKGKRIGDACVSEEHANFIINYGSSAQDIAALVEEIKHTVYKKTGILLREEIRRIGNNRGT